MIIKKPFPADPKSGIVYTRPVIVSFALDLVNYRPTRNLSELRILDVGCGYGQFVGEIARRLVANCLERGLGLEDTIEVLTRCVRGVEINRETASAAREAVFLALQNAHGPAARDRTFLRQIVREADFLDDSPDIQEFDLVVGNLPYVRYEAISKLPKAKGPDWIRDHYHCFRGRADYSTVLFERSLQLLAETGEVAMISSNRFTRAEYGKELRRLLAGGFQLHELDLTNVRAFDEKVTAYASLFLLSRGRRGNSRYICLDSLEAQGLTRLTELGPRKVRSTRWYTSYSRGRLPNDGGPWPPFPSKVVQVFRRLIKTLPTLDEEGVIIRKGPATGADHVFIRPSNHFPLEEATKAHFLLPLFRSGSCNLPPDQIPDRHLLSTYESGTKRLRSLEELPVDVERYLQSSKEDLERRQVVRERHQKWWGTIDHFDPDLKSENKVLIPDLQKGKAILVDEGALFPGHSVLFALAPKEDLYRLAHLLRSPLTDLFRAWNSPSMRDGGLRASPKVLARLPCPDVRDLLSDGACDQDFDDVYLAYGLHEDEVELTEKAHSYLF